VTAAILYAIALLLGIVCPATAQNQQYDAEIRDLVSNPQIQAALAKIEELDGWSLEKLIELTEIPAPPFMEMDRAARYAELMREVGADSVVIDEVGNVIAWRRGTGGGKTVAMAGHMDTVFPEGTDVTVKFRGDTMYAPGIGDDTRGLIVVLTALRAMEETGLRTESDLLFIGTVGEEGLGDLRGVKQLFSDTGPGIDSWIAIDGGDITRIVNHGLGSHRYKVTFNGPGGHSWGAFGLGNPAHAMGRAIAIFDENAAPYVAEGIRTSYNIGRMGGGTSVNSIPFSVWMEVDMRSESPERLNGIDEIFQAAVRQALEEENVGRLRGEPLTVDVEMIGDRPSGVMPEETPLLQRAAASARHFGAEPSFGSGSTDSNIPISMGIPGITIGRGGAGSGAHSLNEWWMNRDAHVAIQHALVVMVAEAGLAGVIP
jgi:acetylornithine deacetylase/succinyl-diaminopimelate desuccinylase-like protein